MSQSPVLTMLAEASDGLTVLRAFGPEALSRVVYRNELLLDNRSAMNHLSMAASCWFTLRFASSLSSMVASILMSEHRVQLIGVIILLFVVVFVFHGKDQGFIDAGLVGLSINYGLSLSAGLQSIVIMLSWFEVSMVSL